VPKGLTVSNRITENSRDYDPRTLEAGAAMHKYAAWLLEDFVPHLRGRVIEVGAGIGTIAERYVDDVKEAILIEPARSLCETLKQRVAAGRPHVHAVCRLLHEAIGMDVGGARVDPGTFDAAIMVNVLEHIEDDEGVLRQLYALLKPGGALLVFVPAVPFLYGALDERVGHVRRYTKPSLENVFGRAGFAVEKMRYFDFVGMAPWFITGRILRRGTIGAGDAAALYDRWFVPFCAWVDDLIKPRIGKNLVAIGSKPLDRDDAR
jgi:SAM-dependent methyltransferase